MKVWKSSERVNVRVRRVTASQSESAPVTVTLPSTWEIFVISLLKGIGNASSAEDVSGTRVFMVSGAQVTQRYFEKKIKRAKHPIGTDDMLIVCLPGDNDYRVILGEDDEDGEPAGESLKRLKRQRSVGGRMAMLSEMERNSLLTSNDRAKLEQAVLCGQPGTDSFFETANPFRKNKPAPVSKRQHILMRETSENFIDLINQDAGLSVNSTDMESISELLRDATEDVDRNLPQLSQDFMASDDDMMAMLAANLSLDAEEEEENVDDILKSVCESAAGPPSSYPHRSDAPRAPEEEAVPQEEVSKVPNKNEIMFGLMQAQANLLNEYHQMMLRMKNNKEQARQSPLRPLAPTPMQDGTTLQKSPQRTRLNQARRAKVQEPQLLVGAERRAKIDKWLAKRARSFKKGFGDRHVLTEEQVEHRRKLASDRKRINGRFVKCSK